MKLRVGKQIEQPKQCYELVLNYANRDDELTSVSKIYRNENEVIEVLEILNYGLLDTDYANGERFYDDIPNFSKHFIFNNVEGIFPPEFLEQWEENQDTSKWDYVNGVFTCIEDDERFLWDYSTCSGEIPLIIYSWELYLYDEDGNKYKMEVDEIQEEDV